MKAGDQWWVYGGSVFLIVVSSMVVLSGYPRVWAPLPLPLVLVAWLMIPASLFVTSILYWVVIRLSWNYGNFPKVVFALVFVLGGLDFLWIVNAWEYGNEYQGSQHTKIVALENILGFGIVLILSLLALKSHSRTLAFAANLGLFTLLSWCAFPYLGELM